MHFVCGPVAGGAEIFVKDMTIQMAKEGHSVHIVFLQTAQESNRDESFSKHFLKELTDAGIEYSYIGVRARANPVFGIRRIRVLVRGFSPDIIHAHLYQVLFLLFFVPGAPVVFTKHSIQLGLPRYLVKILLLRVSAFVAICEACKGKFEKLAGRKLVHIDNGATPWVFEKTLAQSNDVIRLVYLGRLSKEKNIELILRACSALRAESFMLSIVGEGPEYQYLQNLATELDIEHKVSFLGNIDHAREFLSQSDIFLMSSLSEGLPISLIEAAMSGLPCVVTDVGGCSEVIKKCKNGFVVQSGDVSDFRDKVSILLKDSRLRQELSSNALEYSKHYQINRVVQDHLGVYRSLYD